MGALSLQGATDTGWAAGKRHRETLVLAAGPSVWSRQADESVSASRDSPWLCNLSCGGEQCQPLCPHPVGEGLAPLEQAIGPSRFWGCPAPLPLVDLLVLQEVLLLDKALFTLGTPVGTLACVDALVPHQI